MLFWFRSKKRETKEICSGQKQDCLSIRLRGRKDVVLVNLGETVRLIMKFEDYADPKSPFMYHCHILEHEDTGMMDQFIVA